MGRGRRRGSSKPDPIAFEKVSEETIAHHYAEIAKAKEDHEEAVKEAKSLNGMFRARLKDAQRAGIPPSQMLWRLAQRFRDPNEIDKETRERNRIAKATNLPIGTQLGFDIGAGETIATQIDNAKQAVAADAEDGNSEEAGYQAAKAGKTLAANPHLEGSDEFDLFEAGWKRGVGENVHGKNIKASKPRGGQASAAAH